MSLAVAFVDVCEPLVFVREGEERLRARVRARVGVSVCMRACVSVGASRSHSENANMPTAAALWGYIAIDDNPADWGADHQLNSIEQIKLLLTK